MGLCDKRLLKYSAFNYGHSFNNTNRYINFLDGVTEKVALIPVKSYTLGQMANVIASAMNAVGEQIYTVTLNRADRSFTISAPSNFQLLISTGVNAGQSAYSLLGFTGSDLTGTNSYTGGASGKQYITQTPLTEFSDFEKNKEKLDAVVRKTPTNVREAISYGLEKKMKCDFPLITNITGQGFMRNTPTGVEEADDLMVYLIDQKPVEFLESVESPLTFTPCVLDATGSNSKGVGFEMVPLTRRKLPGYYEIKGLVFSQIEV